MSSTLDMNVPMCQTQENPWCTKRAEFSFICKVEGREVRMCGPCNTRWKAAAAIDAYLLPRCPNCTRNRSPETLPRPVEAPVDMLGKYTEIAVMEAMRRVGVLSDQRDSVIRLLKTDLSVWTDSRVPVQAGTDASG